jgi:hypothetical protein
MDKLKHKWLCSKKRYKDSDQTKVIEADCCRNCKRQVYKLQAMEVLMKMEVQEAQ